MSDTVSKEQIKSVCEEVQHLVDHWAPGQIAERDLRAGSAVLRRLLVYHELQKVWRALMGDKPFFVPANRIVVAAPQLLKFHDLLTCSEVLHNGNTIFQASAFSGKSVMTPLGDGRFRDDSRYAAKIEPAMLKLSQFCNSVCLVVEGHIVRRDWIIKYVAHSLGGTHFGDDEKKDANFRAAMHALKQFDVGDMPVSIRELLGISQALCRASCTSELLQAYASWKTSNGAVRIA